MTHSFSRRRLAAVCPLAPRPSMQFQPSHQAEDMGAMLGVPLMFWVVRRTTGVPR